MLHCRGSITTDANSNAIVELQEWFEALDQDFRYKLTVIGQCAHALVARRISNHCFAIRSDKPNVEVSWLVTGIRHDAWAEANRIQVKEPKNGQERGRFLHPELHGAGRKVPPGSSTSPAFIRRCSSPKPRINQWHASVEHLRMRKPYMLILDKNKN
jgi:hypothetical protein